MLVRTSDHGDLLGAHGGLHQKWFNLYDEATRVPFTVVRTGADATSARVVDDMPTSHVDIVPTLLSAAGIDQAAVADELARDFSEVHPLPGRDLMEVVDGRSTPDRLRPVYLMTRDNVLEGDTAASRGGPPPQARQPAPRPAADPGPGPRGLQLRGHRGPGRRRRRPRRRRPPLEAGADLRRPGHLDRARRAPPGVRRPGRPGPPLRAARRPVGALRPHRRPHRGRPTAGPTTAWPTCVATSPG